MTTWYTAVVAWALALTVGVGIAFAGGGQKAGDKASGDAPAAASQPSASPKTESSGAVGASASADFSGRHTMQGEVTRIDQKKGTVSVKTAEGTMDLHFPPSALSTLKKGDRVSVELALKPDSGGSASPATAPKASGGAKKSY